MSVTLTGYSKAIDPQTGLRQGLHDLKKAADPEKAVSHLADLRRDLQSKSGVVRLLHTSSTDDNRELKFKNAGAFKRFFVPAEKLKRSGEVITELLRSAGLSDDKVREFEAYARSRGGKGVQAQKVLQFIDATYSETGSSPADALSKFGVDLGAASRSLGSGKYGEAREVRYRGEAFVYKQPKAVAGGPGNSSLGQLSLARTSLPDGTRSYKLTRDGLANAARVKGLPQVITPSVFVVKETDADGAVQHHAVAGQKTLTEWARTQRPNSRFEVVGLLMPKAAGKSPIEYPQDSTDETLAEGAAEAAAKAGEAEEAEEAETEAPQPPAKVHVSRSDLKPMAASALELLKGLASHGFIHGDIKPDNLFWDSKSKTLQLIDNDGLQKVSNKRKESSTVQVGLKNFTHGLLNPVAFDRRYVGGQTAQLGLGRDLFAMGMVLLETALIANGHGEKTATRLMDEITFSNQPEAKAIYLMNLGRYKDGIKALENESFAPGSVEAFARRCIVMSVEHELARLDQENAGFDRYSPDNDSHLLAQLTEALAKVR